MAATNRRDIIDLREPGIYHCWSRCVRRALLCGLDKYSKKDYNLAVGGWRKVTHIFCAQVLLSLQVERGASVVLTVNRLPVARRSPVLVTSKFFEKSARCRIDP